MGKIDILSIKNLVIIDLLDLAQTKLGQNFNIPAMLDFNRCYCVYNPQLVNIYLFLEMKFEDMQSTPNEVTIDQQVFNFA